jgi:hypothetical protein
LDYLPNGIPQYFQCFQMFGYKYHTMILADEMVVNMAVMEALVVMEMVEHLEADQGVNLEEVVEYLVKEVVSSCKNHESLVWFVHFSNNMYHHSPKQILYIPVSMNTPNSMWLIQKILRRQDSILIYPMMRPYKNCHMQAVKGGLVVYLVAKEVVVAKVGCVVEVVVMEELEERVEDLVGLET